MERSGGRRQGYGASQNILTLSSGASSVSLTVFVPIYTYTRRQEQMWNDYQKTGLDNVLTAEKK